MEGGGQERHAKHGISEEKEIQLANIQNPTQGANPTNEDNTNLAKLKRWLNRVNKACIPWNFLEIVIGEVR